jgi:hypothetical protein
LVKIQVRELECKQDLVSIAIFDTVQKEVIDRVNYWYDDYPDSLIDEYLRKNYPRDPVPGSYLSGETPPIAGDYQ